MSWNEELGEWQLKFVAYTGNNMRKPKETEQDLKKVINPYINLII